MKSDLEVTFRRRAVRMATFRTKSKDERTLRVCWFDHRQNKLKAVTFATEYVNFGGKAIGDAGLHSLMEAIKAKPDFEITSINLWNAGITRVGFRELCENLPVTVRHLNLAMNVLNGIEISALAEMLERVPLEELWMEGSALMLNEVMGVCEVAFRSSSLNTLNVEDNNIHCFAIPADQENLVRIFSLLKTNRVITDVWHSLTGFFPRSNDFWLSILEVNPSLQILEKLKLKNSSETRTVSVLLSANAKVFEIINPRTPPLGDGQYLDSGGDLAELPNEVLALVAARVWPARSLLELSWTCRLARDCAVTNWVAFLRYGEGKGDWRFHYREAWLEK